MEKIIREGEEEMKAFTNDKTDYVMDLWLSNILEAHHFIGEEYWRNLYEKFKTEYLLKNEAYYLEEAGAVIAFSLLQEGGDIIAFFVDKNAQNRGVGQDMLRFLKSRNESLSISIYEKNQQGFQFFLKNGFEMQHKQVDMNTGETEIYLQWRSHEL